MKEDEVNSKSRMARLTIQQAPQPVPHFVLNASDPMAPQLVRMWAQGAELAGRERGEINDALLLATDMETFLRQSGQIPMRWNATAPVITRRPLPICDVSLEEFEDAMADAETLDSGHACSVLARLAHACGIIE